MIRVFISALILAIIALGPGDYIQWCKACPWLALIPLAAVAWLLLGLFGGRKVDA